jgi:hypothetical protein
MEGAEPMQMDPDPRIVHVAAGTNEIVALDSAVAELVA